MHRNLGLHVRSETIAIIKVLETAEAARVKISLGGEGCGQLRVSVKERTLAQVQANA